ncbi:MAG: 30S ribosomal protein S9 [Candidatus Pacebacteria bacterium]|nr:30S ribosomal protein S9 [Candidatus Paceibacterota bacterium]MCD8507881.1 30S ribosomal protein S9 [Candidatus Paceibacterota bacterium]MCD8527955.1 30S ribosomal protein S9 [Candidatus Paceibacterota bacterium]MCD8563930.1 30S ribosomal protein S9 [Candidatus Paceibacterota bacterium]
MTDKETTTLPQEGVTPEVILADLPKIDGYIKAVGRRKTATAQVRISDAKKTSFVVNGKEGLSAYFPTEEHVKVVQEPFTKAKITGNYAVTVVVRGGGIHAQAEAIRHGLARCFVKLSEETLRSPLKKQGLLKRDPRKKERKKPGLRKARKSAQWSKR